MRASGILMHISSLPNKYGIGTFGKEAYQFIDFLNKAGQKYWQILPLGHTSYKDSPYQTFSTFAGNPYFIDLDLLTEDGLLQNDEYQFLGTLSPQVDYGFQYFNRYQVLRKAYQRFNKEDVQYHNFKKENQFWLNDYTLFMTIKGLNNDQSWLDWPWELKSRNQEALEKIIQEHQDEMEFWSFIQFEFFKQWRELRKYATKKKIKIIGDIPIYVAMDSADVWSHPQYFQIDENYQPLAVAGCPPDAFSKTGQLWGNPLYNYDNMKKDQYSWWVKRVEKTFELCDVVRIDHFRGFEAYWSIPYGDKTAERGKWVKGPNLELFNAIYQQLGKLDIIAEDLGFLTPEVHQMLDALGYPGMKILEFGFDEKNESDYMPHNIIKNCVVYPGTHDNDTIKGWFIDLKYDHKRYVMEYLNIDAYEKIVPSIIKCALGSVADLVIIQMQDYLGLGSEARMNLPNTQEGNWQWRVNERQLSDDLAYYIKYLTKLYWRTK